MKRNQSNNLPVAEIIECNVMGQQTIKEIEGRLKFLRTGDKLYTQPSQVAQPEQTVEPHDLQKRLADLHLYEEIAQHYAECAVSPNALRDWVAERMDEPVAQPASPVQAEPVGWFDPTNTDPSQSVTFKKDVHEKWPHIYKQPFYTHPAAPVAQPAVSDARIGPSSKGGYCFMCGAECLPDMRGNFRCPNHIAQPVQPATDNAITALIDELEETAGRYTQNSNNPIDGLLYAAANALRELHTPSNLAQPASQPETAWLIEEQFNTASPRWFIAGPRNTADFSLESNAAVRFSRRADAQSMLEYLTSNDRLICTPPNIPEFYKVTEHQWIGAHVAQPVQPDKDIKKWGLSLLAKAKDDAMDRAALAAFNEHFFKCTPSCTVKDWTNAWKKAIAFWTAQPVQPASIPKPPYRWLIEGPFKNVREAIDAAIASKEVKL